MIFSFILRVADVVIFTISTICVAACCRLARHWTENIWRGAKNHATLNQKCVTFHRVV